MPHVYGLFWMRGLPVWAYITILIVGTALAIISVKKVLYRRRPTRFEGVEIIRYDRIQGAQEASTLWEMYDTTFQPANKLSPCKQSLDHIHFVEALHDSTVRKYILTKKGPGIIGVALVTNDFKNTPWISEDYFKVKYPDEYAKGLAYYFMGMAIRQDFRGNRYSISLLEYIIDDLPRDGVLGFDHSRNVNPFLHHFTRIVRQARLIRRSRIDRQHYHVAQLKK